MAIAVVVVFGYLGVVAFLRDPLVDVARQRVGRTTAEFVPLALIVPSIAVFLTPLVWAERKCKRFALICPECDSDVTRSTARILATRCCSSCGNRIVQGGLTRPPEVFDRYSRLKQRRFLVFWFWVWPVLGASALVTHWVHPSALANCIQVLFLPGLIGTVATGWAFARTADRRYLPQFGASAIVLAIGTAMFWNAFW